jgi:hypothetical protein
MHQVISVKQEPRMRIFSGRSAVFTEFVIVVFGILAALAVDDWRDDRADRASEREYLQSILLDLQLDNQNLEEIFTSIDERIEAAEALAGVTAESIPQEPEQILAFLWNINVSGFYTIFQPVRVAVEDMISSGNLRLIKNRELRLDLLRYHDQHNDFKYVDEWIQEVLWMGFRPEANHYIPLNVYRENYKNQGNEVVATPADILAIINDPDFQYGIVNARGWAFFQRVRYQQAMENLKALIAAVEQEIQNPAN